jgi:hypothetical protein
MLLANLDTSEGLVNGARGRITGVSPPMVSPYDPTPRSYPVVRFENGITHTIEPKAYECAYEGGSVRREDLCCARLHRVRRFAPCKLAHFPLPPRKSYYRLLEQPCSLRETESTAACELKDISYLVGGWGEKIISRTSCWRKARSGSHDGAMFVMILPPQQCFYVQLPLRLSDASSVHKSQGQTLDRVYGDVRKMFRHGQAYTFYSRVRSIEGLFHKNYSRKVIVANPKVRAYYERLEAALLLEEQGPIVAADAAAVANVIADQAVPAMQAAQPASAEMNEDDRLLTFLDR